MKKLSVGLPFRGQGKGQTKSWLLLLALGLLACMTMCLILVWSNIERIDTTYFINIAQNKLQERKALRAKLEVERERLLSPYELRRKAGDRHEGAEAGAGPAYGSALAGKHHKRGTHVQILIRYRRQKRRQAVPHRVPYAAVGPGVFLLRPRTGA